ncbi:MAG: leucine--tRNA ligase [Bacteroides sp.]|jgi:leucyl-tRNA synthetase|nr:leucine--tRNA ligase [Bacteroides sp.]
MDYNFREVEKKWQDVWKTKKTYKTEIDRQKPKFYVLDMFPYPSGAGLHVGHPLGYIASDIYARFKRLKGFNVLHPMGYDAYGLPAEQYAIQTGQHPAITTERNINRYREQLDKIGFSFDWDREVRTCDPGYYKWTQWTFIQLFNHYYNNKTRKAEPIAALIAEFEKQGNAGVDAACDPVPPFSAADWKNMDEAKQQQTLMQYRLAYLSDTIVNWCPALGTVLANDEVKEGFSVRGNHPVEGKKMQQWFLRITAYAERLLEGLERIEWSDSLKEIQRNWIGRSEGATIFFGLNGHDASIEVFTTRPDTIFGATFMVLAPEHELVKQITTPEYSAAVENYVVQSARRSDRERMTEVKTVSGQFTGAYAKHPFSGNPMPVYIADYVLAGYGTGAIMAVPAHDSRDYAFARHFGLDIVEVVSGGNLEEGSYDAKEGTMINSDFINGLEVKEAISTVIARLEQMGIGTGRINFRLRDAIFSRQRYWGEPFPVYYKDGIPYVLDESELPLELPEVDKYLPTETGEPPLARANNWKTKDGYPLEHNTMPGFAGSSAYYLRYMDPRNDEALVSKEAVSYWQNVDLYVGGAEHATGHLIYSRFWNKFLFDLGIVVKDEPFQKLINQGMIQGRSNFVYRVKGSNTFVSHNLRKDFDVMPIHVDVNFVHNDILDLEAFRQWNPEYREAEFVLEEGKYLCGWEVEKMSKSFHNVQNPDDLIERYGADTLRLYEMFLGPIEQAKPWDTNGIEGVFRFIRKLWRLYNGRNNEWFVSDEPATEQEKRVLHKTIKKVGEDIEKFSFNTAVSSFMICVNELGDLGCNKREILEPLAITIASFAPHLGEELWHLLGHSHSVTLATFPQWEEKFVADDMLTYPVSFNGKTRFKLELPAESTREEVEAAVMAAPEAAKWLEGKAPKRVIVVPGKIVNVVI